jgi:hypothetical protein
VYCAPVVPVGPGRAEGRSRLTGCLATSLVRLQLLVLDAGGEPLPSGEEQIARVTEDLPQVAGTHASSQPDAANGPRDILSCLTCHHGFPVPAADAE